METELEAVQALQPKPPNQKPKKKTMKQIFVINNVKKK